MTSALALPGLIHPHGGTIKARVYRGHWIGDCGNPYCGTAMRLEYGSGYLCTGDEDACGWAFDVEWPSLEDARKIVALLVHRPDRRNRNWYPHETPLDLMFENVANGIGHSTTPELGAAASQLVLDVAGDGPPVVQLFDEPLVIDAHPDLAIGA